jgi:hypothetical protein
MSSKARTNPNPNPNPNPQHDADVRGSIRYNTLAQDKTMTRQKLHNTENKKGKSKKNRIQDQDTQTKD